MYNAVISKEYGEVKRNGRKVEDYAYEVEFRVNAVVQDRHCYRYEDVVKMAKALYESRNFYFGSYGAILFPKVFVDEVMADMLETM